MPAKIALSTVRVILPIKTRRKTRETGATGETRKYKERVKPIQEFIQKHDSKIWFLIFIRILDVI